MPRARDAFYEKKSGITLGQLGKRVLAEGRQGLLRKGYERMRLIVLCLFFASGVCGLIYQVAWTRVMTNVFGATVFAVSLVLTAFMTGLAIGSYFLGRRGDRSKNPLRLYAYYEIGIGLTAVVSLFLMNQVTPLYLWLNNTFGYSFMLFTFARFVVAFFIIIVPTVLMGATLPILSRFVITKIGEVGRHLGGLYSVNTFGAVCGSLLAGFFLIGHLGVQRTIYLAALINIGIGFIAWIASQKYFSTRLEAPVANPERIFPERYVSYDNDGKRNYEILLFAFALSGFTSFAYEIFWTRSLIFVLGNSTYSFVTMLTAFLLGIALGGYVIRFFVDRITNPLKFFAWTEVLIGLSAALAMPLLIRICSSQYINGLFTSVETNWGSGILIEFGISLLIMLVPTIMIGATFPLVGKIYIKDLKRTGADAGKIYASNTLGNILGAFVPAFVIIPVIGLNKGILLMAGFNIAIGAIILLSQWKRVPIMRYVLTIGLLCASVYIAWLPLNFQFPSNVHSSHDKVLFYKEGISATTKVHLNRSTGKKFISVDGVVIGSSVEYLDHKQQLLAHLPKLLLNNFNSELSIGLGSGMLIAGSAKHKELKKIVCVEIAPSVVEGAALFEEENDDILNNPRVEIVVNDGINHLLTTSDKYDIISSDAKSQPKFGGNGVFFSKEYYTLIRDHLTQQGLAIQWFATYYPHKDYLMIIKTFSSVFPYVSLWFYPHGSSFLVGSKRKVEVDFERLKNLIKDPTQPFGGLRKYGLTTAEAILSHYVASEDVLKKNTMGIKENSFEYPFIEFYSLKEYAVPDYKRTVENIDFLMSLRTPPVDLSWIKNISVEDQARLRETVSAEKKYIEGLRLEYLSSSERSVKLSEIDTTYNTALEIAPWNEDVRHHVFSYYLNSARFEFKEKNFKTAENYIRKALNLFQENGEAHLLYGIMLEMKRKIDLAISEFKKSIYLEPKMNLSRSHLANIYLKRGEVKEAINQLKKIVENDPENASVLNELGWHLARRTSEYEEALGYLKRAYMLEPKNPRIVDTFAWITYLSGDLETAREIVKNGGHYFEKNSDYKNHRDVILKSLGEEAG